MRALWTSPVIPPVTKESRPIELLFASNPIFTDAFVSLSPVVIAITSSAYIARRQTRWSVILFTTIVVTLSKKAVSPKQVLWHVLSPRRSSYDLSPDPDSHRLHDQFNVDDIANLRTLLQRYRVPAYN